jgi:hypothetical protein
MNLHFLSFKLKSNKRNITVRHYISLIGLLFFFMFTLNLSESKLNPNPSVKMRASVLA